jgi:hypothetical protein
MDGNGLSTLLSGGIRRSEIEKQLETERVLKRIDPWYWDRIAHYVLRSRTIAQQKVKYLRRATPVQRERCRSGEIVKLLLQGNAVAEQPSCTPVNAFRKLENDRLLAQFLRPSRRLVLFPPSLPPSPPGR